MLLMLMQYPGGPLRVTRIHPTFGELAGSVKDTPSCYHSFVYFGY